jgi:hypothetical protein
VGGGSNSGYRLSAAPSPAGSYRQPATPQPVYAHQVADFGGHPVIQPNPQHTQPIMPGHSASSAFQVQNSNIFLFLCCTL